MCDVCADVLALLYSHDRRLLQGEGLQLTKNEAFALMLYAQAWQQRQCMCCFKDFKNYERMNNIVQVAMNMAIKFIVDLPFDCQNQAEQQQQQQQQDKMSQKVDEVDPGSGGSEENVATDKDTGEVNKETSEKPTVPSQQETTEKRISKNEENVDVESERKEGDEKTSEEQSIHEDSEKKEKAENVEGTECSSPVCDKAEGDLSPSNVKDLDKAAKELEPEKSEKSKESSPSSDKQSQELTVDNAEAAAESQKEYERTLREAEMESELLSWTMEEKDRLFNFVTKIFLMNFPLYMAYKHSIHTSLEELSQQEASALNNYCELSLCLQDPEVPVYLLRNVCFFCDRNGIQSIAQCFDRARPDSLPYTVAHTLINIIANLRLWMNINTVMQHIVPLRSQVIRYMCRLSDTDLRMAGTRNMMDLMWAAVKEPIETHVTFDREGLDLAFKYFTCTTLTIRLAGITQINNQINLYNEIANTNDSLIDADSIGNHLANWLIENKIIEHIFGPNLHVELIKQSQMILNFLAIEGRITNVHIDSIWAAGQLKHCSRQVHDILIPLIKNLEVHPAQHLLQLVSSLEAAAHTEQTLYLASALIRYLWNTATSEVTTVHHHSNSQSQQYTALSREHEDMDTEDGHVAKQDVSSSEHSESGEASEEEDLQKVHLRRRHHARKRSLMRKGQPGHMKRARPAVHEVESVEEGESENSSLCGNSDLSDISDESLQSELSEREQGEVSEMITPGCRRKRHKQRHLAANPKDYSESDVECGECGETSEDVDMEHLVCEPCHQQNPRKHKHLHRKPRHCHKVHPHGQQEEELSTSEEEDEEEEDEEEYIDSDDHELMKHVKVVQVQSEEENEESSEFSSEEYIDVKQVPGEQATPHKPSPKRQQQQQQQQPSQDKRPPQQQQLKEKTKGQQPQQQTESQLPATPGRGKVKKASLEGKALQEGDPKLTKNPTIEECQSPKEPPTHLQTSIQEPSTSKEGLAGSEDCAVPEEIDAGGHSSDSEHSLASSTGKQFLKFSHERLVPEHLGYMDQGGAHRHGHIQSDFMEDILSPDEGSCNSSRLSTKSEKNMADFEGEDVLSDDELAHINVAQAGAHFSGHMQQHLANMASMYHKCLPQSVIHHHGKHENQETAVYSGFKFDDVCRPGSTLLWDLLQDHTAYKLAEGIAAEAEKVLCSLVCFNTDRQIRTRFIEACIENIANHRSVVISLRLLPKLFGSFQQYRVGSDPHPVTMWAERELHMTKHFFNNLVFYTNAVKRGSKFPHALYSYREEIQVRLQFLTCIFSTMGSQDNFRLSLEQVDMLWGCLATDPECADDCFTWFLNQARSKEHHAMSPYTFKHIFMEKMPTLKPEDMSMVGLNLFTQLCSLAKMANASLEKPLSVDQISGMDQLWGIALRAQNTDVSLNAIQFLNNHYINYGTGVLEKEEEFVQKCMDSLVTASSQLDKNPEGNLLVIQRGLILLTNHLESFRRRYAFHMRTWQLDGQGISSHQKSLQDKSSLPIRVVLQPAGSAEKTTIEMLNTDLVAELRAEVSRWWETMQKLQQQQRQQQQAQQQQQAAQQALAGQQGGTMMTPILGAMLGDGPVRMITLGQELTIDVDEKTLSEMQFKDLQLVFVSLGASRPPRKHDGSTSASYLSPPPRDKLPMMLLLGQPHFSQLFNLLQQLSNFKCQRKTMDSQEHFSLQVKARVLSRKVWELLMLLPTNPDMLDAFHTINSQDAVPWDSLLDVHNPHKLMYSLQVVESLSRPPKHRRRSMFRSRTDSHIASTDSEMSVEEQELPEEAWSRKFVSCGGLKHLFHIFLCGSLQTKEGGHWSEWNQDCLAYLLRLMSQFALAQADVEVVHDDVFESTFDSPRKRSSKKPKSHEKIIIPTLNQTMLSMVEVERVLKILTTILYEAAMPRDSNPWHTASWGRTEVVHYALSFLVSWAHSCDQVQPVLCGSDNFSAWLKRLTLEAPEPQVRQEACRGIYRLCLGQTSEGTTGYAFLVPTIAAMLTFLEDAQKMKPAKKMMNEEKEPYGPSCRDYFWLLCHLVDKISKEDAARSWEQEGVIDLNGLAKHVADHIRTRAFLEKRHNTVEDDGLIGLLHLLTAMVKHEPPFKTSPDGQAALIEVFWCLFALPSPKQRYLPKCKSMASRSAAYDLMVEMVRGSVENYKILHSIVLKQHHKDSHAPYPWDNWPHEEGRSNCGYVGLTNLGATCYLATCMQHLYMIPQARKSVLEAKCTKGSKHEPTLVELQKMFAYLMDSERKAYNPRSFCKVYTMDKVPLNTGEQKDMAEFFTDLISKLEDMGPELKKLVKSLFGGVITNNVVSLDCPHVSRTMEEFYTVRCQVADMKNLYDSLDEVTVKDMLEGDNMYTCSKCQKKVRAEKRACFRRLPKILCFNTMRYTFNMVTMMKEKVNSHFSFPLHLDMAGYMEENLIQSDKLPTDEAEKEEDWEEEEKTVGEEGYNYELIGVTVHTGTADGGHYYSFIRDRLDKNELGQDRWYLFNDAEVKPFDPGQIAAECFGGEMTSKTYDSVTEKYMDFSFEKTNSAYMLFYERIKPNEKNDPEDDEAQVLGEEEAPKYKVDLSKELADWIWQDNMQFLQDKNIFEHTYFGFMWQMCSYIPSTLPKDDPEEPVPLAAAKLSASFVLETLIHAKEKPTMLQWIELLTKQFNSCPAACEWFLDDMAVEDWWPQQILIKCPNQVVRQMFQRLLIHVISQLKPKHSTLYLQPITNSEDEVALSQIGTFSCVTRFIKRMLAIMEGGGTKPQCRYLAEYFAFLHEFAKMGEEECAFLLHTGAISTIVNFYMGHKTQEAYVEILSDDDEEEEEDVMSLSEEKYRPQSLEKMIALVAVLVEKSRSDDKQLHLNQRDYLAIIGGKGYPFLFNQIRENINLRQTCNLIFSLCRWNDRLAMTIVQMIFGSISRLGSESQPFFKILSMLVEFVGGPPGLPQFTQFVLHKFWDVTDYCPQQCLEWLATQVMRNKFAHAWTLQNMDLWVEPYLMAHSNIRVRNAAAHLLVALVPSQSFRQTFRSSRSMLSPHKDVTFSQEAINVLHEVYRHLLRLLPRARQYVDVATHGMVKLAPYFALMTYCLVSRTEKLMLSRYFLDLWQLFQPKLSEPAISMHHNKQALLLFWHQVCCDCPENVKLIVSNAHVTKNIAFNYILADHDDQDVVLFNRCMLPAYYGILRMCCQQSRSFTRQLAMHQNIQWAFKNITPYPAQYTAAVDELFKMMRLMVMRYPDSSEEELKAITHFRRSNIQLFLQNLDARTSWQTLITALKILMETNEDRLMVLHQQGLHMLQEAFSTLHVMYHEATACHVTGDIVDLLSLVLQVLKVARHYISERKGTEYKSHLYSWKDRMDFVRKLLTLLNSYTPHDIRQYACDLIKEMLLTYQNECVQTLVPILLHAHSSFQDNNMPVAVGPYFPKRGQKPIGPKSNIRPPRPQFQMLLHSNQLEAAKGVDEAYDTALNDFFYPYHLLVDLIVRVTINQRNLNEQIVNLSAAVAYEGVPLHMPYFAKLWYEIYTLEHVDKNYVKMLCNSSPFIDYVDAVLLDERQSLNNQHIYQFFCNYFPKVYQQVLNDQGQSLLDSLIASITAERAALETVRSDHDLHSIMHRLNGDLRALLLIFSVQAPRSLSALLQESLRFILETCHTMQERRAVAQAEARQRDEKLKAEQQAADGSRGEGHPGAAESEEEKDQEEVPRKRRRTDSNSSVQEAKKAEPQPEPCPSTSADSAADSEPPPGIDTEIDKELPKSTGSQDTRDKQGTESDESVGKKDESKQSVKSRDEDSPSQLSTHPSPSKTSGQRSSAESSDDQSSGKLGQTIGPRMPVREKPSFMDYVAKHIEYIFSMIKK